MAKLDPSGSALVYSTYLGGSRRDDVAAIAVDSSGAAYITGGTQSPDFPVTAGAYQRICGPRGYGANLVGSCSGNVFAAKLAPSGSVVYSTFLGGTNGSMGAAIAVDSQGRAYVAGQTFDNCDPINNHCFPTSANALLQGSMFSSTTNNQGNPGSGFVAVFDAAGANLLYGSLFGDTNPVNTNSQAFPTDAVGIAVDPSGNFYLAGSTHDSRIPVTAGAYETTLQTNGTNQERGYVAKFSPLEGAGPSLVYSTYLGGNTDTATALTDVELIQGIAVDAAGNAYVTGITNEPDFPVTAGANQTNTCGPTYECITVGFLTKLNPAGSGLVWSTLVGAPPAGSSGQGSTVNSMIAAPRIDAGGNVYITGQANVTGTPNFPLVNPLQPLAGTGGQGVFVTEYDPSGSTIVFSTIFYTPKSGAPVYPGGMDLDSQGNIYIGGYTEGADLPTTAGAYQSALCSGCAGTSSGFLAKISTAPVITAVVNGASFQPGIESGSWATIEGVNLSNTNPGRTWLASEIVNGNLPTSLDQTSVTIDGKPAYVYYVSPTQLNVQVPTDANSGNVNVVVTNHGQPSAPFSAPLDSATPAFFLFPGTNYAIATRVPDYALLGNPGSIAGTIAAKPGDIIVLWATGFGLTAPATAAGVVVAGAPPVATLPTVTVGSAPVTVISTVLSPGSVGLYQVAIQLPASVPTGIVSVQASVEQATSPTGISLFVSAQ
ncbi:MAG TPA: SBBP repeat-containing protein [Bryobacteraceae bacterium]|nr:SBBP repeat-containing protein [Bryobacteraceae bacterium]